MKTSEIVALSDAVRGRVPIDSLLGGLVASFESTAPMETVAVPSDPRWTQLVIEHDTERRVLGFNTELREPEPVRWDQLDARFGAPRRVPDGFDSREPDNVLYRFERGGARQSLRARVDGEKRLVAFTLRALQMVGGPAAPGTNPFGAPPTP